MNWKFDDGLDNDCDGEVDESGSDWERHSSPGVSPGKPFRFSRRTEMEPSRTPTNSTLEIRTTTALRESGTLTETCIWMWLQSSG